MERIGFIEEQIKEFENEILFIKTRIEVEAEIGRQKCHVDNDNNSEYLDAIDSLKIYSSPSILKSPDNTLKCLLANQKLSWSKIDYKINDLACRLKVDENILEAKEKIIEAYSIAGKSGEEIKELIEGKELSKQRVQILQQSLKKYTSLISNGPVTEDGYHRDILGPLNSSFTGKLLIKVTKIGGFAIGTSSNPPLSLNFNFNQLISPSAPNNFNSKASNSTVSCVVNSSAKDPTNSTIYTCYQEIVVNLVKAGELELTVSGGSLIKGMFFASLAAIFTGGPDEEASLSNSFEIEPSGVIDLQFHYSKKSVCASDN